MLNLSLENVSNTKTIYKVNNILGNKTKDIYVFYGEKVTNPTNAELMKSIFSPDEILNITNNKINIIFSEQQLHFDDTIGTIKIKILNEFKNTISIEELYLFCNKVETLDAISLYETLTQNKKLEITDQRLYQFISNIVSHADGSPFQPITNKETYTYDDILKMDINKAFIVNKVLGQKFVITGNEYPFVCNPFKIKSFDTQFERTIRKSLSTLNNNLLLNTGDIVNNTIYLCTVRDVLTDHADKDLSSEIVLKIYYPFLHNKNINTLDDLTQQEPKLIDDNKKLINPKTLDMFESVDMFYDIYSLKKTELEYISTGIKFIRLALNPNYVSKIPLEIIFKLLHTTDKKPLIKYNSSTRQENIYRLYADNLSTDGRKIPLLKKSVIFKLMKTIGKHKSVAIYVEYEYNDIKENLVLEISPNGVITITSEFNNVIKPMQINDVFKSVLNPILKEVQNKLEQSGYKITQFNNLTDENVEILQLTYFSQIQISKPIKLETIKGCISSVFNVETANSSNNIQLRFKRVSNFNKVTSQEAFIIEKSEQGLRGEEIIIALLENYKDDITRTQAEDLLKKMANEYQVEQTAHKSGTKIKDNPGFKTTLTTDVKTSIVTIKVDNINDINYLKTIPIYLDTIIRLTQNKKSTAYPLSKINKLCALEIIEEIKMDEIVSINEMSNKDTNGSDDDHNSDEDDHQVMTDIVREKPKGAIDLFFDEDDDEEEDEDEDTNVTGGTKNEDSDNESSLSTDASSVKSLTPLAQPIVAAPIIKESTPSDSEGSLSTDASSSVKSLTPLAEAPIEAVPLAEAPIINETPPTESSTESSTKSSIVKDTIIKQAVVESEDEDEENDVRNIDGLKLNKPYYFQTLIEKRDPVLILKEDAGKYNSYSRTCSSDTRRQPVILTDAQLAKINQEHEGFLRSEDVIKYGSDPNNKFNYICPRFWCLKNNTLVDPKDLKEVIGPNGKKELQHPTCGKVLSQTDKAVKPGYYIYEFYKDKKTKATKNTIAIDDDIEVLEKSSWVNGKIKNIIKEGTDVKYEIQLDNGRTIVSNIDDIRHSYKRYPNFQIDKHPDGYGIPCCFDKYNTAGRIKAKERSYAEMEQRAQKPGAVPIPVAKPRNIKEDEYIKGPEKFPLDAGRWGYLPPEIQFILRHVNADCQISNTNTNLKSDHPCLLRHGVEFSNNQSFIACISDALFFASKFIDESNVVQPAKILTIADMRTRIIKSLTVDNFIKYQNGNLVNDFNSDGEVNITKYSQSKLYSKINVDKPEELHYFKKVISSFENFKNFLSDEDAIITHTYLWDIVSYPNPFLFHNGINLVIFEIPADDITNNVQLICPTNHYSSQFYEARKPTIILMKEGQYYEPIYSYTTGKKIQIRKEFKELDPKLSRTMRDVIKEVIKPFYASICAPKESLPNIYKTKRPLLLHDLLHKLEHYKYSVTKLVLNFNNKVIGVVAEEPGVSDLRGFVPCYPSSVEDNNGLDYVFMTDTTLWNNYSDTVKFLTKLVNRRNKIRNEKDIPCKPIFKVVEDEMVVGILTETNQFIQLSEPIMEQNAHKIDNIELPSLSNNNYVIQSKTSPLVPIDIPISTTSKVDETRVDFIKRIKLENSFFAIFRNTVKIMLSDYSNLGLRDKIEKELANNFIVYTEKLNNMKALIIELVGDKVQFVGDDRYYKLINEVSTCILNDINECKASNMCSVSGNNECGLILPKHNLITHKLNADIYFGKMADEIIRYSRIKGYMFEAKKYLTLGDVEYNLSENEIIMLQSLLTQEYFERLTPTTVNKYVKHTSHDEVNPIISHPYDNIVTTLNKTTEICDKTKKKITGIWHKCFPNDYKEIEYGATHYCTFALIIDLIEQFTGEKHQMNGIKKELVREYNKYINEHGDKILDMLIQEGKPNSVYQVKGGTLLFGNMILANNYHLTTLDLWLLVSKYKIPTIFISTKTLLQTNYEKRIFVGFGEKDDKFAFILLPALSDKSTPKMKLIENADGKWFHPLKEIEADCINNITDAFKYKQDIKTYLDTFEDPNKSKKKKNNLDLVDEVMPVQNIETAPKKLKPKPKLQKKKLILVTDAE
jgi:hypothetical protein